MGSLLVSVAGLPTHLDLPLADCRAHIRRIAKHDVRLGARTSEAFLKVAQDLERGKEEKKNGGWNGKSKTI